MFPYNQTLRLCYTLKMIGYLLGKVHHIDEKSITILCGGVGYEVLLPINILFNLKTGQDLGVWIHSHVREDQFTLFGFLENSDRELFRKLISVSGVGPKSALNILSVSTPANIVRAIESGKSDLFPKVPGVGKKSVEKLILELRGKLDSNLIITDESEEMKNARLALETLGYNTRDIGEVLNSLHPDLDMNSLIREALKMLSHTK